MSKNNMLNTMQNKQITKCVILCGGLGTRFLPVTKAIAKEMLPVIDTPVLAHIVQEAIDSGITDILIIISPGKDEIVKYFIPSPILEKKLADSGSTTALGQLQAIGKGANFSFAIQNIPKGSGDAVLHAEQFVGAEPFVLALGDDLIYSKDAPVIRQLINAYNKKQKAILGVQTVEDSAVEKYGIANTNNAVLDSDNCALMLGIVEKPPLKAAPSRLAALGRYILTPDIFNVIKQTKPAKGGELQLTDSINTLAKEGGFYAFDFKGERYDMGDKLGSIKAIVEYAIRNKDFGDTFKQWIKDRVE